MTAGSPRRQVVNEIVQHGTMLRRDADAFVKRIEAGYLAPSRQGSTGNVVAAIASFFIPGLGQLTQGRVGIGIGMFFLSGALWFLLLGWVVSIWSAIDAARWEPEL